MIERKADTLGDLLGRSLVGDAWVVDPRRTVTRPNTVPERSVKEELHDLEEFVRRPPPPRPPRNPPVLQDRRLKKIFVFAEDTFAPGSATQRRVVTVRTPAFDVGGWLDATRLRLGDVVEVRVQVSFTNRRNIEFARTRFAVPGLYDLADFARGRDSLVGSEIRFTLRQPASADGFTTPVEFAYQFVVESQ